MVIASGSISTHRLRWISIRYCQGTKKYVQGTSLSSRVSIESSEKPQSISALFLNAKSVLLPCLMFWAEKFLSPERAGTQAADSRKTQPPISVFVTGDAQKMRNGLIG